MTTAPSRVTSLAFDGVAGLLELYRWRSSGRSRPRLLQVQFQGIIADELDQRLNVSRQVWMAAQLAASTIPIYRS